MPTSNKEKKIFEYIKSVLTFFHWSLHIMLRAALEHISFFYFGFVLLFGTPCAKIAKMTTTTTSVIFFFTFVSLLLDSFFGATDSFFSLCVSLFVTRSRCKVQFHATGVITLKSCVLTKIISFIKRITIILFLKLDDKNDEVNERKN